MPPKLTVIEGGLSREVQKSLPKSSLARDDVWSQELLRLRRRAEKIVALRRGDAIIKKVHVKGVHVKRHFRRKHTRLLIQLTGRDSSTRNKKGK